MKLAFLDTTFGDYTPRTPLAAPLGGMQSAACHLAMALARAGTDVTLINGTGMPGAVDGVMCRHHATMPVALLAQHDVLVVMGGCDGDSVRNLRAAMTSRQKLVLWTQHAGDQHSVANLSDPDIAGLWDAFIFVSRWQRDDFIRRFTLAPDRCHILRNAPAPCFAGLFAEDADIAAAKPWPPVLAYTSTPFRGLDVLLAAMPRIRAAIPGTILRVYSSLEPYQVPLASDPYAGLYEQCRQTEGVEYVGSMAQPALARALRAVTALAYPNRYAETSCISVMEAMAAGCLVVSSHLGALPETAAGFARLLPVPPDPADHAVRFADAMVTELRRRRDDPAGTGRHLRAQLDQAGVAGGWDRRAAQWLSWLAGGEDEGKSDIPSLMARLRRPSLVGDHDAMADLCERVLALDPAHAGAWRILMQVQATQARPTDALLSLGRAIQLHDGPQPAEWAGWMASLLSGVAAGEDGSPLAQRVAAVQGVWPLLSAGEWAGPLVAATRHIAGQARAAGDMPSLLAACLLVAAAAPQDAGIRLVAAMAAQGLGDGAQALELAGDALRIDSATVLGARSTRSMLAGWLAAAEQTALERVETVDAGRLFPAMALVAGALGEDASLARQAAAASDGRLRKALLLRMIAARHRLAGRRDQQVELLRQAAGLGVEAGANLRLNQARLALSQRLLLENLGMVLNDGANGRMGEDWRDEAKALIGHIEQSLHLKGNDEGERSVMWGTLRGYDAFLAWFDATGPQAPPLPAPPPQGRKVYDCFQFYNELDLLELRLAELSPVVDHFVLVEAAYTHAGAPKPLYFAENRERFAAYADKIIHVVVDDDPGGFAWVREAHQRQAILRGLDGAGPADLVIVSDADEILRPDVVRRLRDAGPEGPSLFTPHLDIHLYFLNLRAPEPWISVAAAPYELVRRVGANNMRYLAKQNLGQAIPAAGWHFTWMGGIERFLAKLDAFAHREMIGSFGHDDAVNRARLERFFATGRFEEGAVPGMWTALTRVPIDGTFPASLRALLPDFTAKGWIAPGTDT
ncbi:glycosyltransferase [Niveispirillum sp. KHB5.9]|uniref:glycosyltransferase n=1 Tax=Niveispirillum sp. KHB5.9 TaxID=3400269 RepID=UPI003A895C22